MSNELLNRNKANVDADLLAAKEEARRVLSDDELGMVTGGVGTVKFCPYCGASDLHYCGNGKYKCSSCGEPFVVQGDERVGMNEAMADIDGLLADIDGWD